MDKIFCAPGNAGISALAECIDIKATDFDALVDFVKYEWVDLTVVGPEEPLSRGIVDAFEKEGRRILGPTAAGARLESSKVFAKDFMRRYGIPSAEYKVFSSYIQAEDYVKLKGAPIVVKADGLAAGKGVFVCASVDEAVKALRLVMKEKAFGEAGNRVVVEECLEGEEASFMAFTDGETIAPVETSQDHKRAFDGDEGPNTGGMGAYSPAPVITPELRAAVMKKVMLPTIRGLKAEGIRYRGVIYAGLMIKDGEPQVLEFNCRLGDPETQPVLARLQSDLAELAVATADGKLAGVRPQWRKEAAVCVVLASGGYPGGYQKGKPIRGLKEAGAMEDVVVFHAGTAFGGDEVVTSGGRVLGVTALGADIRAAKERAYEAVRRISFEGMHYRKDIADRAIRRMS
ncbi:MAG: phosphoribosylamine--glycine ligase [Thermodesulfovibrionales bacterium]